MKRNNYKSFNENYKKKSHNQKIHDAHVLRTKEKEAAQQVFLFFSWYRWIIIINFNLFSKAKAAHKQAVNNAMAQYKANKQSRLKKLVKKTRRGQPVMQGQIELLLDKIQKQKEKQ